MFVRRLCSTVVLLAVFAGIIFGNEKLSFAAFAPLSLLLAFFAPYETCRMLESSGRKTFPKTTSILVSLILFLTILVFGFIKFFFMTENHLISRIGGFLVNSIPIVLLLLFAVLWFGVLFAKNRRDVLDGVMTSSAVFLLFAVPVSILAVIYFRDRYLFLFLVLVTKLGDIGAYAAGTLTNRFMEGGNHKMVPSVSPGKSWEGAVGGLIVSVIGAILLYPLVKGELGYSVWTAGILGVLLFVFGEAGDLAESSIKRSCGAKDSGKTIPGIGGVFDLVDSLMLNSILFAVFLFAESMVR